MKLTCLFILLLTAALSCSSDQVGSGSFVMGTYTLSQADKTADPNAPTPQTYLNGRPVNNISEYLITLEIGSQNQSNNLVFDTGSSDLLLLGDSTTCPTCSSSVTAGTTYYKPTGTPSGTGISISYGSGTYTSATAEIYSDTINFNAAGTPSVAPFEMPFLVITTNNQISTGILGLAYPNLSKLVQSSTGSKTFLEALNADNTVGLRNLFAVTLCGNQSGSRVILGSYDPAVPISSNFQWIPVSQKLFYSINATDFWVQDWDNTGGSWVPKTGVQTSLGAFDSTGTQPIIDTGTTMTLLNAA